LIQFSFIMCADLTHVKNSYRMSEFLFTTLP